MSTEVSDWLLDGPRGRRLCRELLSGLCSRPVLWAAQTEQPSLPPDALAAELTAELDGAVPTGVLSPAVQDRLLDSFARSVDCAWYWQEPDGVDRALALPEVQAALMPLARLLATRAPSWWAGPVDLDRQRAVQWPDPVPAVSLDGAADKLATWRTKTLDDERGAAKRPRDVRAPYGGHWWSAPCLSMLPTTTRALPTLGAVELALVEDHHGWTVADCVPVRPRSRPRIYEITGPDDWVALVTRYPLEVSLSRRHDWWRATATEARWFVPDYLAASADYDAVHLTARAYLTTAGIAHEVAPGQCTVLAGWNPDQTYWLTDALTTTGTPQRWVRSDHDPCRWAPASEHSR